jgi:flagellar biosynthesis anti-sigma factor FlgM
MSASSKGEQQGGTEKSGFSSEMNQVHKGDTISAATDPERAEKLESLKERINNGSYDPDMREVASSLLDYLSRMRS